jgi:Ran GTPase-activating protein (RanGAP) involved in mRNA processing and transport
MAKFSINYKRMPHSVNIILPAKQRKIESLESDDFCKDFREQLKAHDALDLLCLSGNSYSDVFFDELGPYLQSKKHIKRVILSDIFTTRKNEILPALRCLNKVLQNKGIQLLDMSSNALCPDGCLEIVDILKTNQELKYLYLNHVALSEAGSITIAKAIQDGKLALKSLQVIKNRIENAAPHMAKAILGMHETLEELIIYQNNIREGGMTDLLEAIHKCDKIHTLDISDNLIGDSHIDQLTGFLHKSSGLKLLKLDDCNITPDSTRKLILTITNMPNKDLQKFTYNYNDVDDVGELIQGLTEHKGLRVIECKGNDNDDVKIGHLKEIDILLESCDESEDCCDEPEDEESKIAELIKEISNLKIE